MIERYHLRSKSNILHERKRISLEIQAVCTRRSVSATRGHPFPIHGAPLSKNRELAAKNWVAAISASQHARAGFLRGPGEALEMFPLEGITLGMPELTEVGRAERVRRRRPGMLYVIINCMYTRSLAQ
ncbi:hypothetical protein EVAR_81177_1 [Eumeta japonica]|uniref:Uncharacterized protein n=1 Tax=Eumeta variegata TaxID=151549 RepID=A0A4C1ULG6_EUMVA|nr:hypothetical protein EVAR_81177_1 [Eumeta japonica]